MEMMKPPPGAASCEAGAAVSPPSAEDPSDEGSDDEDENGEVEMQNVRPLTIASISKMKQWATKAKRRVSLTLELEKQEKAQREDEALEHLRKASIARQTREVDRFR